MVLVGPEPRANIATPTGNTYGVLDIDGPAGADAIRRAGIWFTSPGPIAKTPRGWHYYFRSVGSTRTGVLPLVDWKDTGGYVIVPPSRSVTGELYSWIDGHGPDQPIPPLPDTLLELVIPVRTDRIGVPVQGVTHIDRYVDAAIENEANTVRSAIEGGRNIQLNESTFKLGRFAMEGSCDPVLIVAAMADAADRVGLTRHETRATIRSALAARIGDADAHAVVHQVLP